MQSRVDRHDYDDEILNVGGRTKKNAELYKQGYTEDKIVVPKISNGRELDEEEFEKIINQSKTRSMKVITEEDVKQFETTTNVSAEEKNYDINSVLEAAKKRRGIVDNKQYKVPDFEERTEKEENESSDDSELLSDLMGSDNTIVTPKIDNVTLMDTVIEYEDEDDDYDFDETKIDDSFYSKSLKFEKKDFAEKTVSSKNNKKHSKIQLAITIVIVVLLVVAVVLGILILSKIKF